MKNKLYYILLGLLTSFSFMGNVFAENLDFTLNATADKQEVVIGEEVTITLSLKSNDAIANCLIQIVEDSNLVRTSIGGMENGNIKWTTGYEGENGLDVSNSSLSTESIANGVNVLQLKYKVNGDGAVRFKTKQCASVVGDKTGSYEDVVVDITAIDISKDTSLSSLSISDISPDTPLIFSPTQYVYPVELTKPNFSITMTTSNPDYQDDIVVTDVDGNVIDPSNVTFSDPSGQGLMPLFITINGNTEAVYELGLKYEAKDLNNSLSSLKINGETIPLKDGEYDYEFEVSNDVTNINLEATLSDSENFRFDPNANVPGNYSINNSITHLLIVVEPKSSESGGKIANYRIKVIKNGGNVIPSTPDESTSASRPSTGGNVGSNPGTGGISMFVMALILISSLIGSIFLYQKNLESYR